MPAKPGSTAGESLGGLAVALEAALAGLREERVLGRIWDRDPAVWGKGPREVVDRLGWLDLPGTMRAAVPELADLAAGARAEGVADTVVLGMGGSSLGAEVLRGAFPPAPGYPRLTVLDSTVPGWVEAVRSRVDPARTLFVVATKSGTTAEVVSLYRYFRAEVEAAGVDDVGRHFVAITDPGTELAEKARARGFRRTFLNPQEVGGRFSVLSYFGLVPAALLGLDTGELLARAGRMARESGPDRPPEESPGGRLGAILGTAASSGRDKLTLLASPGVADFALWAEQLVAESTGKEGKGIVPVTGEPVAPPESYRRDRLFVALRLAGDDHRDLDRHLDAVAAAGHPVVRLDLADPYDLGAEFFRWEMATAVAGHLLGVHPFDQPDVDTTKSNTREILAAYAASGRLPEEDPGPDLAQALAGGRADYVALMAYLPESRALEEAVAVLRARLLARRLTSTFGYAPRMLHSTGQLHKGGPGGGLFIQLLPADGGDGPVIPGQPYGFGTLARAQAAADARALRARGRPCLRLALTGDPAAALSQLTDRLSA